MDDLLLRSLVFIFILTLAIKFLLNRRKQERKLPPSPPAIPIIGHLHLLKQPLHRTFHSLSQKYGAIVSLRLGSRLAVVVSSPSLVEECFTKNDIVFANRPFFPSARHLSYNQTTLGAAPYGDHWRNLRRIASSEIFSPTRLNMFVDVRKDEVKSLLRRLYHVCNKGFVKVKLRPMFMDLSFNIVMRMVAGKRYYGLEQVEEARRFREILTECFQYTEVSDPADIFPILKAFGFTGVEKKCMSIGHRLDVFLQELVDEHRNKKDGNAMINRLLDLQQSHPQYYTDEIIKGLMQVLLLAGTETTATTLEWAMSNMLNHPDVLKKDKEELDTQVGQHRLIDESDYPNLQYLQRLTCESLRLYPTAPYLVPHLSSDECTIGGYYVPEDTMLFVNAWSIHRDPKLWDDPTKLKPERFGAHQKVESSKFLPFGLGRRACPGDGLAKKVMTLTLGALIQCFCWERVNGDEIDMTEKAKISMSKVEQLELMCKPQPNLEILLS
ncbi:hypothetical protein Tsubulata_048581 [Turnera subulata]|uniref:Cytochrome P450 n=1 Tax=Turnera subulata TaxID=218843 RepID=A0A9Q0J7V8_9ROSI|nr:hypothetical protein Tsubulata_048581 [Turnera subulata]